MLIVSPPEVEIEKEEEQDTRANILDLSELDIDFLKDDSLEKNDINMTAVDVNYLDVNFFEDGFDMEDERGGEADDIRLTGTSFGLDKTTQVNTLVEQTIVTFLRAVNNVTSITTDKTSNINISITDNGKTNVFQLNNGGTSITINQGN
jgi:hypothetical protein